MRLENKIAIVTGAGQSEGATIGNGRATALRFAQEGASVFLTDRNMASAMFRACLYSGAVVSAQSVNKLPQVNGRREEPNVIIESLAD